MALPDARALLPATVRWFEDRYTISDDWPDECFVNHSFTPSGLWHLGFVFATTRLEAGTEITVDYRHLLAPGQTSTIRKAESRSSDLPGERVSERPRRRCCSFSIEPNSCLKFPF